jgi:hypothetical protein
VLFLYGDSFLPSVLFLFDAIRVRNLDKVIDTVPRLWDNPKGLKPAPNGKNISAGQIIY